MSSAPEVKKRKKIIAIVSKPDRPDLTEVLPELERWLEQHDYSVVMDEESAAYFTASTIVPRDQLALHRPDLALALAGEATPARLAARGGGRLRPRVTGRSTR